MNLNVGVPILLRIITATILICYNVKGIAQNSDEIWFDKPATYFEETLVLGNGKMGASIFGGIQTEKIFLNDITLWSGEPMNHNNNPEAYKNLPEIRAALKAENYKLADSLNKKLQGQFSQSYAPLGTLLLHFKNEANITNYKRSLDLTTAIADVSYESNGVKYNREYFISNPKKVMVVRLTSDRKKAISFDLKFESQLRFKIKELDRKLIATGYAPVHVEPSYRGSIKNPIVFDANKGTRFTSAFSIKQTDGTVKIQDAVLSVQNATEVELLVAVATSFNGFDKNPATEGLNHENIALDQIKSSKKETYANLKKEHVADYSELYNRVDFKLSHKELPNVPTDQRLLRYETGANDQNLEILYFNYGRYLLIASSRTKEVPANLQGLWNPHIRPPWSSNYTININLQENYWLAETANLPELHQPLLSFIGNLSKTGAITAKTYYGTNGWAAGHNSDIWALTNPVGDFGQGNPNWANWNMGGVWLTSHLWEHYLYTKDTTYLKEYAYPIIKGAATFASEWLIKDKHGQFVSSPSTSPENLYKTPEGYVGATLYGATADMAMIKELFYSYLNASKTLAIQDDFTRKIKFILENLSPYKIGQKGNLQEWYYDWEDQNPKHRHQTHLYGLHPGNHITPYDTPKLAEAAKTTLDIKGDETTGWSKGWRINLWARLWDGNRAYKMYRELLRYVNPDTAQPNSKRGGTYPNLFDAHPPFQIDGNFGGAAGVIEMLMQSNTETIYLLPALPDAWQKGSIKGIKARGGFEIDLDWEQHKLIKSTVSSLKGGKTTVSYKGRKKEIHLNPNESINIYW